MSTATQAAPKLTDGGFNEDDTDHLYCCNENVSLCGADITDSPDVTHIQGRERYMCVVCHELETMDCERCGE